MIGFLGTVIGMIVAFHEMASAGGNIDVAMLSQGIYTAMVTTVAGLVVGIIAFIAYNYLVSKVDKVVFMLEAKTTDFLDKKPSLFPAYCPPIPIPPMGPGWDPDPPYGPWPGPIP